MLSNRPNDLPGDVVGVGPTPPPKSCVSPCRPTHARPVCLPPPPRPPHSQSPDHASPPSPLPGEPAIASSHRLWRGRARPTADRPAARTQPTAPVNPSAVLPSCMHRWFSAKHGHQVQRDRCGVSLLWRSGRRRSRRASLRHGSLPSPQHCLGSGLLAAARPCTSASSLSGRRRSCCCCGLGGGAACQCTAQAWLSPGGGTGHRLLSPSSSSLLSAAFTSSTAFR